MREMIKVSKLYEVCSLWSFICTSPADMVTGSPSVFLLSDFVIKDEAHLHPHPFPDPVSPQSYEEYFCNSNLVSA